MSVVFIVDIEQIFVIVEVIIHQSDIENLKNLQRKYKMRKMQVWYL